MDTIALTRPPDGRKEPFVEVVVVDPRVPWWVRAYLLFAAFQGWALGVTGLVSPDDIQIPLRMSPLNERFVATLYLAGGIGVLLAAFSRRRAETRLFVLGFAFATTVILIQILLRWGEYMADGLPHRPAFLAAYILDPALALFVIPSAGFVALPPRARHSLSALLQIEAAILGIAGLGLLVIPSVAAQVWPWALPPALSQLYAAFFLSLALGAFLAAGETHRAAIQNFLITSLALTTLVIVASLLHLPRFKPGPVSWVWFAAFVVGTIVFATVLVRSRLVQAPESQVIASAGG